MNKKQESRFSMYLATADFCEKNTELTDPLPNFSTNLLNLKTVNGQIHLIAEILATDISGTTAKKNNYNETLIVLSADTSRKLTAFAKLNNDQQLLKEISFTESDLIHLPGTILPDTAKLIYDRAQTHLTSLVNYRVTAETQDVLKQAIADSKQAMSAPRLEKVSQVQATKQLAELFVRGDETLANMDAIVEIVRLTEVNFYAGYKSVRKIIQVGKRKISVKGLVTDGHTGEPLKGVAISFWLDGDATKSYAADEASLTKKTAEKGGFYVSSLPAGAYRLTLQKAGYAEQNLTIYVNNGELTLVDVKLAKL